MSNEKFETYWQGQESSMNRDSDENYYARKAVEHLVILARYGEPCPTADLGCGAGELLAELAPRYPARIKGIDYSESLLSKAKERLNTLEVELHASEACDYAQVAIEQRWMTCGAVNQYSDSAQIRRFMRLFVDNTSSQELYLFDTICPVRLILLRGGVIQSYLRKSGPTGRAIRQFARKIRAVLRALQTARSGVDVVDLGSMGYGIQPAFWREMADLYRLDVRFFSSAEFEYRYHVRIAKKL